MTEPVELSGKQCLDQLRRHGVGRVAFGTPMGPRILPVRYILSGSEILFRTVPYSEVGTYAPDSEVAFEVDDADASGHCECTVVALGRAEVANPPETSSDEVLDLGAGSGGTSHEYRWIKVRAHDFVGRCVPE